MNIRESRATVPPLPPPLQRFVLKEWEPLVQGEEPPDWNSGTIPGIPWRPFMARLTFKRARSVWCHESSYGWPSRSWSPSRVHSSPLSCAE